MKLMQNEEIILSADKNRVTLTDCRIFMDSKQWGKFYKISIFLEDISSIEAKYVSHPVLLIIGILLFILGFAFSGNTKDNISILAGLLLGLVFILAWWFEKKCLIKISSNGGSSIKFEEKKKSQDIVDNFILNVHEAKSKRINLIYKL